MSVAEMVCDRKSIHAHLMRVLSCKEFDASDRNRRFLEYVVEETISGRADRIKAYSIATAVFGRSESFDPQQDAIVRIEAGRLRRSLKEYYLTAGVEDPIRISIPVGSYVPAFTARHLLADMHEQDSEHGPRRPATSREPVHRPTIHVSEFVAEGNVPGLAELVQGVTRRVIAGLTQFTDLAVVGFDCPDGYVEPIDVAILRIERNVDFVLSGSIATSEGLLVAEVLLRDTHTGQYIWADSFELGFVSADHVRSRIQIADRIVGALGQPSGVIFSFLARRTMANAPAASESFESVVRFHNYWRTCDRDQFDQVRLDLERTIERDPHYAEAFACLSQLYTNAIRFGYGGAAHSIHPLQRAITLAKRAIQLSPASSRAYLALGIAYWFDGQVDSALDMLRKSREMNPSDMEVAAELGMRLVLRANWNEGISLIKEAYERNPALPETHRIGLSVWHFVHGRFEQALTEARDISMPDVIYPQIMIAVSAHRLGRGEEAKSALGRILALRPGYGGSVAADLESRSVHPDVIDVLIQGLRDAGLATPSKADPLCERASVNLHQWKSGSKSENL